MAPDSLRTLKVGTRLAYPPGPIRCGDFLRCEVSLHNTTAQRVEFDDQTRLAYHWLRGEEVVVWDGTRTPLPRTLDGHSQEIVHMRLAAPPRHGPYSLQIGIVRENSGWFHSFTPDSVTRLRLHVDPAGVSRSPHAELNTEAAQSLYTDGHLRPLSLACETINVCNQACVFCAYSRQTRARGVMPMAVFEAVLGQYERIGGGALSFTTVGEVLLDPLLARRLDAVEAEPAVTRVSATTNATVAARLSDTQLKGIIPRLGAIQISVYGLDAEENQRITQVGNYADMVSGMRRILERAKTSVSLAFRTAASRPAIEQWVADNLDIAGCEGPVTVHGPLRDFGNFATLKTNGQPFTGATWRANDIHKTQCLYPAAALKVFWNGNLSFCACADHDNEKELHLGNVMETPLIEVIQSEKFKRLWNWSVHGVPEICRRCTHYLPLSDTLSIPGFYTDPRVSIGA